MVYMRCVDQQLFRIQAVNVGHFSVLERFVTDCIVLRGLPVFDVYCVAIPQQLFASQPIANGGFACLPAQEYYGFPAVDLVDEVLGIGNNVIISELLRQLHCKLMFVLLFFTLACQPLPDKSLNLQ